MIPFPPDHPCFRARCVVRRWHDVREMTTTFQHNDNPEHIARLPDARAVRLRDARAGYRWLRRWCWRIHAHERPGLDAETPRWLRAGRLARGAVGG